MIKEIQVHELTGYEDKEFEEVLNIFKQQYWFKSWKKYADEKVLIDVPYRKWISRSFDWAETEESPEYWNKVHTIWDMIKAKPNYKPFSIPIYKIGAEFESSCENINKLPYSLRISTSTENYFIKEVQLPPIYFEDFEEFLHTFLHVCKNGGFNFVKGADDPHAGSLHLHISFKDLYYKELVTTQSVFGKMMVITKWFQRKTKGWQTFFRDAIDYRAIPAAAANDYWSKEAAITINYSHETVEFRINENPLPLWVYFVPYVLALPESEIWFNDQKNWFYKHKKNMKKFVEENYKDFQKDVLLFYLNSNLDIEKTYQFILENWKVK